MIKCIFVLIISLILTNTTALAFREYTEKSGAKISFSDGIKSQDFNIQRKLFIKTFDEEYKNIEPQNIKPYFKNRDDVTNWLSDVFEVEHQYFISAKHPMHWITMEKDHKMIGFIVYEQWKNNKDIWHIRQMAILPDEQRKGYGTVLIKSIFTFDNNIKKIIVDTRRTNVKAINFYKKNNFEIT
ncbi:MAG: GNAT family N-acetyltransferase, partial [Pseudomonadota bacterium]